MFSALFSILFLFSTGAGAAEKAEEKSAEKVTQNKAEKQCVLAEATPLLNKSMYAHESDYNVSTINEKPITLTESVNIDKHNTLKIEQRGCHDVTVIFKLETKRAAKNNAALVTRGVNILNQLHLDSKAVLSQEQLDQIATKIKNELKKSKGNTDINICLLGKPEACIRDIKVATTSSSAPTAVEFHYVSRP